jgi:hypothetical protein
MCYRFFLKQLFVSNVKFFLLSHTGSGCAAIEFVTDVGTIMDITVPIHVLKVRFSLQA